MPLTPWGQKLCLDWMLGGAAASSPAGRWVSFATASPNATSAYEAPYTPRCTVTFGAAASPDGSASNNNVASCTLTAATATPLAWNLWDASVGGNRIAYGTLTSIAGQRTAGSTLGFAAGALRITLV